MWTLRLATGLAFAWIAAPIHAQREPSSVVSRAPSIPAPGQDGVDLETRAFSTPETLLVRALYERATGHVEGRRWSEAITDLQTILEKHAGELLATERPATRDGRPSAGDVHPGACLRARRILFGLTTEARALYRDRFEVEAARALAAARSAQDAWALAEVGRRWPLCDSAARAYVSLFDMELEQGHEVEARCALARALAARFLDPDLRVETLEHWTAMRARVSTAGDDAAGIVRRIDFVLARMRTIDTSLTRARNERGVRLPSLDEAPGPIPGEGGDAWTSPFVLPPNPYTRAKDPRADPLFAVRAGERVFVSTSLRLLALQAYTGELLWDSNEPRGWTDLRGGEREELFKGVDLKTGLVAPAASENVVVAALQLPFALLRSDNFNTIKITTPIPERRLFAFDAATGRKLWDHTPPKGWDGDGGTFAQRSTIAGPPVIAGSRVLAPCVRMQGRINYNVGCFDLDTGELLWSRDVISGQREQNMFGRAEHEFTAAPLRVEGDRVVAITQLGTIACLDLFTGEILWETLHEVIQTPRNHNFGAPEYPSVWRNTPPVVADGVVLATPVNSNDLVALDLATGALLWSQSHTSINAQTRRGGIGGFGGIDLLLGASKTAIYLGGDRLLALDMPSGIAQRSPLRAKWVYDDDVAPQPRVGRPVLASDGIVLPRLDSRVEVDLETGLERSSVEWPEQRGGGNVLLGTGEMFVVSPREVRGFFEWDVLVERARAELTHSPRDTTRVLRLARLLDGRGASEWSRGKSDSARAHYAEARTVLERALTGPADDSRLELAAVQHSILRGEARVRAALADANGALTDLRAARAVAPDKAALRDTLAEELAILIERENTPGDDPAAARDARDEMERSCADLSLLTEVHADDGSAPLPFGASYRPVTGGKPADDVVVIDVPAGLWVAMERARIHARANDTRGEFADLHAVLERYADTELVTGRAGDLAEARIGALLAAGRTDGFEEYESRAQAILDAGVRAHDDAALQRVARLYPATRAAHSANDARLSLALLGNDVAGVAKIVASELPDDWNLATCTEREARLVRRLAHALGQAGNRQAEGTLLRSLAATRGDTTSDLPEDAGRTFAQLAEVAPVFPEASDAPDVGRFRVDPETASDHPFVGDYEILGETIEGVPSQEITAGHETALVCAWNRPAGVGVVTTLVTLGSSNPLVERWSVDLPTKTLPPTTQKGVWTRRTAFAAGRVIVAMNESVAAYDTQKGTLAWQWAPPVPMDSMSIVSRAGVAIVVSTPRADRDHWIVTALDAHSGAELWRDSPTDLDVQRLPIVSDEFVVFVPMSGRKRVVVRDLFTGARAMRFDLDSAVTNSMPDDAWIEGRLLIVPWFNELRASERNQVLAVDLTTGRRAWRAAMDETGGQKRWLYGVLQQGGRSWLVLQSTLDNSTGQSLCLLDTRIGALTPISSIRMGDEDRILGLVRAGRVELPAGPIAVLSPRTGTGRGAPREARVRCIDLDRGELWIQSLGLGFDELAPGSSGLPAVSDKAIAITVAAVDARARLGASTSSVWFFDVRTGQSGGRREVRKADGRDVPELVPLGDALLLRTRNQLEVLR